NSNVTGSLPDFNEWANGVASKVNSNVTGSLPDFNEWANGVASKVNSNVTGSFPDFNEWANGVSQNTLQLFQSYPNFTGLDEQILQNTRDSAQKLINIANTLSNLQDTSASTGGVAVNTLLFINQMYPQLIPPLSCKQILRKTPNSPSGHYILTSNNGATNYSTYCNMGTLCGSGGGWTRLAYLDMSDPTQNCPSALELYQSGSVRACGRSLLNIPVGCVSVKFPSNGISYFQICGRVTGYQHRSTDGPNTHIDDLNSHYVDGVSITHGSPRQHVWTLMAGNSETSLSSSNSCPCNNGSTVNVQSFVGDHYFCESGNKVSTASNTLYTSDPLWDGQGCGSLESPCCNVTGIPWFHRDYGSNTTTDYIELRMCSDFDDEDTPVGYYEIYVK
uniref:Fibrinogen C-terminal domain-containing protein n=1 Tax=Amphimedon queenslandica TaxID=400682 RepID=A0A1X7VSQ4_AMPQE